MKVPDSGGSGDTTSFTTIEDHGVPGNRNANTALYTSTADWSCAPPMWRIRTKAAESDERATARGCTAQDNLTKKERPWPGEVLAQWKLQFQPRGRSATEIA